VAFCSESVDVLRELYLKYLSVKEEDRIEGLVLAGRGKTLVLCQMSEKGLDLRLSHLGGMSFVVEVDVLENPIDIGSFCTSGVVPDPYGFSHLIHEFG